MADAEDGTAVSVDSPRPVTSTDRISSLDVIRGVAVFGILLMNIVGFSLPYAYDNPTIFGGGDGLNLLAWQINTLLFEGTMRGLFSLLFGAGMVLMTLRAEERGGGIGVADIYLRRNLWLIAFGVVHAWLLLWPGDILYIYGIAGLILFVFRKVEPRTLAILGVLVLASIVLKDLHENSLTTESYNDAQAAQAVLDDGGTLDDEQQEAIDGWQEIIDDEHPSAEKIRKVIDAKNGSYFDNIAWNAEGIVARQSYVLYMYSLWDALGMMFFGMALLKMGVLHAECSGRFYLGMILFGYGIGIGINYYEMRLLLDSNFDVLVAGRSLLTYDTGRTLVTLGHVGLVMTICQRGWLRWLTVRLAAVGRMALTSYVSHTLICAFIFTGVGLSMFGELQRFELYYVVLGIWIFQLIVSPIWLKYFRFGPLEWLWRSLTYNQRQTIRRTAT